QAARRLRAGRGRVPAPGRGGVAAGREAGRDQAARAGGAPRAGRRARARVRGGTEMIVPDRDARVDSEIAAPLRAASAGPDELHAARLAAAIDAALDREDGERAARRQRAAQGPATRRRRVVAGAVAAAVLVLAIAFRSHRAPAPAPLPAATVNAAGEPPRDGPPALLRRSPGSDPGGATPSTSLVAPRGERARATIGTRVRLTLVGAGRVSVLPAARDGDIELSLEGGRLLVDYDGHAGGTLRVRSPGATTTVVG